MRLLNPPINHPSLYRKLSSSVTVGTTTWRIHTGTFFLSRYQAKRRILSFGQPVRSLWHLGSICLMSSMTKSVIPRRISSFFIHSLLEGANGIPEVSIQVWILSFLASVNNSVRKSSWSRGSPPVTVMPPSL